MSMTEPPRVLVGEFITGGGCAGGALPASLAREGEIMARGLVGDLLGLGGLAITLLRDARLGPLPGVQRTLAVRRAGEFEGLWAEELGRHDLAFPVAPETGGVLERLTRRSEEAGVALWSPDADTVALAASKRATAARLAAAGLPVVPTATLDAPPPAGRSGWVLKPDDGVGCEGQRIVPSGAALTAPGPGDWVVQPLMDGMAASLTVLCRDGEALLLAANVQRIERVVEGFRLRGVAVNALREGRETLADLAAAVARALPGLRGCVGVDLVLTAAGPMVLEVNPRITTAYAGLRSSLLCNPMALVREALAGAPLATLAAGLGQREVWVDVESGVAGC